MRLLNRLRKEFRKEMSIPSWISVMINSNYFISRGIANGIRKNAHYMTGKMMDFGCGIKPYRSLFSVVDHVGVDIENTGHSNSRVFVDKFYDGKTIPFESEYFDSIFSAEVLTHIFNVEEIVPELNRVLKKGGFFLLTVPFVWKENEKPNDSVRYTSFGIAYLLEKHGFQIVSQQKSGHYLTVVFQLLNDYIYSSLFPNVKIVKALFTFLLIFPLNCLGLFLSSICPTNADLFMNSVIVARKK